jgi:hypothetical protein
MDVMGETNLNARRRNDGFCDRKQARLSSEQFAFLTAGIAWG